ncbi:MAG: aminoglycoside phosphotransferase family protein [Deltaproteobacteria bacterium]|nr:aminoglycoside phosphotransferase family protein [Deltaproteobacteria bacterium]
MEFILTASQIERAFSPLFPGQPPHVQQVFAGNINTIIQVAVNGRSYGLRVRVHEQAYRYEPNLIKEAFVLWLMKHATTGPRDKEAAVAFEHLTAAGRGIVTEHSDELPVVRYYDWSRAYLPHPYCIYEWVEGAPLWETPHQHVYALAGQTLVRIHHIQFSAFYADFLALGVHPVSWPERYRTALDKERVAAQAHLPRTFVDALGALVIPSSMSTPPCLVHNDFAPGNIIVRDGTIAAVIDWDNAVIDVPHLDFVKMKYWTAKNTTGELAHDPALFGAFVDGYGPTGRDMIGSPLFVLYEVLWLLRVFNFERAKEKQGLARAPGYPAAASYERRLAQILRKGS